MEANIPTNGHSEREGGVANEVEVK